jgi:glycosyltransferase involved in cell wall biosynthesis
MMELAASHGANLWLELDDLLWHVDSTNVTARHYSLEMVRASLEIAAEVSRGFVCSTEPLARELRLRYPGRPVHVFPNRLPDHMLDLQREPRDGPVRVVWAGSSTHHGDFGNEVRYGVKRCLEWTDAELFLVGHDYRKAIGAEASIVPWSDSLVDFQRSLVAYDIGLCPLAHTRFNQSKSGIKAMEYQAAGVVPVASDVPAYRDVITHGETGFLCRTAKEWKDALMLLATDHSLRREMSEACQALSPERTYSHNAAETARRLSLLVG